MSQDTSFTISPKTDTSAASTTTSEPPATLTRTVPFGASSTATSALSGFQTTTYAQIGFQVNKAPQSYSWQLTSYVHVLLPHCDSDHNGALSINRHLLRPRRPHHIGRHRIPHRFERFCSRSWLDRRRGALVRRLWGAARGKSFAKRDRSNRRYFGRRRYGRSNLRLHLMACCCHSLRTNE